MGSMQPVQSYKQVTVDGPASRAAATQIFHAFVVGVDDYRGPTAANNEVPTGAKVMSVTIMLAFTNLVSVSSLLHLHVVCTRSGQPVVAPGAVGGDPNRNTVIHTMMKFLGQDQNSNFVFQLRIPKIYQRVRLGDRFLLVYQTDTVFASATQVIYKFYR